MPRERIHSSNAEKQKAYRDRRAAEDREAYRQMKSVLWDALENHLAEKRIQEEEATRFRRLFVKHLPAEQ